MNDYLMLLFSAMCLAGFGGVIVGLFWRSFREDDRDSTGRFPRPGTEPTRPKELQKWRNSPDMLKDEKSP